jgi:hypothetical protein
MFKIGANGVEKGMLYVKEVGTMFAEKEIFGNLSIWWYDGLAFFGVFFFAFMVAFRGIVGLVGWFDQWYAIWRQASCGTVERLLWRCETAGLVGDGLRSFIDSKVVDFLGRFSWFALFSLMAGEEVSKFKGSVLLSHGLVVAIVGVLLQLFGAAQLGAVFEAYVMVLMVAVFRYTQLVCFVFYIVAILRSFGVWLLFPGPVWMIGLMMVITWRGNVDKGMVWRTKVVPCGSEGAFPVFETASTTESTRVAERSTAAEAWCALFNPGFVVEEKELLKLTGANPMDGVIWPEVRTLALVGDRWLKVMLAERVRRRGGSVGEANSLEQKLQCDANMGRAMKKFYPGYEERDIAFQGSVAATLFEAYCGVCYLTAKNKEIEYGLFEVIDRVLTSALGLD